MSFTAEMRSQHFAARVIGEPDMDPGALVNQLVELDLGALGQELDDLLRRAVLGAGEVSSATGEVRRIRGTPHCRVELQAAVARVDVERMTEQFAHDFQLLCREEQLLEHVCLGRLVNAQPDGRVAPGELFDGEVGGEVHLMIPFADKKPYVATETTPTTHSSLFKTPLPTSW